MIRRLRNALRALLGDEPELARLRADLEVVRASHDALAQRVVEELDDRVLEADKLYAKVKSALGRLYRLKGWEDEQAESGKVPLNELLAAKFKRGG
jgi:hypothetical protein